MPADCCSKPSQRRQIGNGNTREGTGLLLRRHGAGWREFVRLENREQERLDLLLLRETPFPPNFWLPFLDPFFGAMTRKSCSIERQGAEQAESRKAYMNIRSRGKSF
jgi:hypothetical protein